MKIFHSTESMFFLVFLHFYGIFDSVISFLSMWLTMTDHFDGSHQIYILWCVCVCALSSGYLCSVLSRCVIFREGSQDIMLSSGTSCC